MKKTAFTFIIALLAYTWATAQTQKDTLNERKFLLLYELDISYLRYCETTEAAILNTILKSPLLKNGILKLKKSKPILRIFDLTQQFYPVRECWRIAYALPDYKTYIYDKLLVDLNSGVCHDLIITAYRQNRQKIEIELFYNLNDCSLSGNPNHSAHFFLEFNNHKPFITNSLYSEIDD